jgi:hypothetical protein
MADAPMPSSLAPSSPAASYAATDHPVPGAPTSSVPTPAPAVDPLRAAAPTGPHDMQLVASAGGLTPASAADRSPATGAPPSHVAHHNETLAELDTSTPHGRLHVVSAGEDPELESEMEPIDTADDGSALASAGESATESEDELPTLDAATLAHFVAIQGALTFREGMLARALAAELSPAELRAWMAELRELSVADAVAKVRAVLNAEGGDNCSGGAS